MGNRTCRVGLHGRNNVTFAEVDFQVVNTARIEAMKVMGQTDPAVFKRLKQENPNIDLITRLYDDRFGTNTHPSAEQFAAKQIPVIKALQPYCAKFEVHNEPNHLKGYEGWGQEDYHAKDFNTWFLRVYDLLKAACPWAKLGFPGLAIPHRDLEWIELCRPSVERADWLGVHCYWQTPAGQEKNHLTDFWGLRFKYYHQKFPTKIIEITECGNSNIQAEPPIAISDETLGRQFVEYFQELFKYPYLNSASFFILSSQDPAWDFFTWRSENGRIKPVVQLVGQMPRADLASPQTVYKPVAPSDVTGTPVVIGGGQGAVAVQITNITDNLTQSAAERYPTRALTEINRIIVHHTAVSEKVGAARIAQVQVEQLHKPGITYHYFIASDGAIYQTNALTTVADHTQGHNQNGLAVCFAGNFTAEIPTEAQLKAGGALCAALILQLNIPPANVQGASELVNTQSPGKQWLTGQKWQALLISRINEAKGVTPAEPVTPPITPPVDGAQIAQLKAQIAQLTSQLAQAQARISQLEAELARLKSSPSVDQSDVIADLREYIALLELQLSVARESAGTPGTTPASQRVEPPPIRDITASLAHHATERYLNRDRKTIKKLVIHHTGVPASITTERIAAFNVTKNGWPGIGFHYVITDDGTIQQTNALETIAYHAGNDNDAGIGIAFAGEFSHTTPTSAQISRGGHLIAWLLNTLSLPPSAVVAHKDVADTPCPGKEWDNGQNWRASLMQAVQTKLSGGASTGDAPEKTYHYMLFKDQADMSAAAAYLNKFQPQTGFNAEEALGASYVSVVGNYTPFPADIETRLRANGAKIDRIAGNSPLATQALLENMSRTNRRFLTITEGG